MGSADQEGTDTFARFAATSLRRFSGRPGAARLDELWLGAPTTPFVRESLVGGLDWWIASLALVDQALPRQVCHDIAGYGQEEPTVSDSFARVCVLFTGWAVRGLLLFSCGATDEEFVLGKGVACLWRHGTRCANQCEAQAVATARACNCSLLVSADTRACTTCLENLTNGPSRLIALTHPT